jgi:hypothetical protein
MDFQLLENKVLISPGVQILFQGIVMANVRWVVWGAVSLAQVTCMHLLLQHITGNARPKLVSKQPVLGALLAGS